MKLNTTQLALQSYLKAQADKITAWVNENPAERWACFAEYTDEAILELAAEGINTIEEYDHRELADTIYDVYKDVHGIRPRHMDLYNMSSDELQKILDGLNNLREIQAELENVEEETEFDMSSVLQSQYTLSNGLFD